MDALSQKTLEIAAVPIFMTLPIKRKFQRVSNTSKMDEKCRNMARFCSPVDYDQSSFEIQLWYPIAERCLC
jgi:hypothetical protein